MKEAVVEKPKEKVLTYEDYLKLTDDKRYELINGRLEEMPAPTTEHQRILGKLYKAIDGFVEKVGSGEALISPVDVVPSTVTVVQPDLLFLG